MYIKQLSFAVSWKSAPTFLLTRVVTQFLLTYKRRLCHICRFRSLSVVALANFFVVGPCNGFEICVFAAFSFQRLYLIVSLAYRQFNFKREQSEGRKKKCTLSQFFTCTLFGQLPKEDALCRCCRKGDCEEKSCHCMLSRVLLRSQFSSLVVA